MLPTCFTSYRLSIFHLSLSLNGRFSIFSDDVGYEVTQRAVETLMRHNLVRATERRDRQWHARVYELVGVTGENNG